MIADGSYSVFVTRPISLSFLIIAALFVLWPFVKDYFYKVIRIAARNSF